MTRLAQHMQRLEARWRPKCIAAILRRVRQCAPADVGACLVDELDGMDRVTFDAIMTQLTDAELEALMDPEAARVMATLSESELKALASGDRAAQRRIRPFLAVLEGMACMSLPRLCFRVARLEVRSQTREDPSAQGLASLLDYARRHDIAVDHVPLASRTGAELDGKLAALAGARELSLLLRECLEEERARRQVARATEAPA